MHQLPGQHARVVLPLPLHSLTQVIQMINRKISQCSEELYLLLLLLVLAWRLEQQWLVNQQQPDAGNSSSSSRAQCQI